jgi:hypothetical protein
MRGMLAGIAVVRRSFAAPPAMPDLRAGGFAPIARSRHG